MFAEPHEGETTTAKKLLLLELQWEAIAEYFPLLLREIVKLF
jgi:hypothetical protein